VVHAKGADPPPGGVTASGPSTGPGTAGGPGAAVLVGRAGTLIALVSRVS
jgi:hypothetical protein